MRRAVSNAIASVLLLVGILIGVGGYYFATNLPVKTATTTVYVPAYVQQPGAVQGGSLYVTNVGFDSGGNVTVSVSNSGGGTPIVGYGNTGQIARWLGSIIVFDGKDYSRWAWPCPPNDSCAVAPGPWRYFAFEGNSTALNIPWNSGPGTYYGAPMTVNGLMSVPIIYHWTPGSTYTVYLEDINNTIVYQQTVTAP